MSNFLYLLWHLDISVWHVHDANDTHSMSEKERRDVK